MATARSFSGTEARQLLRRVRTATLSTLNREDGIPYGSLVNLATDVTGWPLILVSSLAWHTRNLLADARASLLVAEPPASGDALTGPRVTVMGQFTRVEEEGLKRRYLACHPQAAAYAGFGDFAFWRLEPLRIHAVAGFGRIETMEADEVFPSANGMIALEESAIQHMNKHQSDAIDRLATRLGYETEGWRVETIDSDGIILVKGQTSIRSNFTEAVYSESSLEQAIWKF